MSYVCFRHFFFLFRYLHIVILYLWCRYNFCVLTQEFSNQGESIESQFSDQEESGKGHVAWLKLL